MSVCLLLSLGCTPVAVTALATTRSYPPLALFALRFKLVPLGTLYVLPATNQSRGLFTCDLTCSHKGGLKSLETMGASYMHAEKRGTMNPYASPDKGGD